MKREGRAGKGRHAERVGGRAATGRQDGAGRGPAGRAAMALCNPLAGRAFAAGLALGAAATSVRTQRRKRPPLLPLPGDLLRWGHQASRI